MSVMSDHDILHAMEHFGGSFVKALAAACRRADPENLARIKAAFPELWTTYADLAGRAS